MIENTGRCFKRGGRSSSGPASAPTTFELWGRASGLARVVWCVSTTFCGRCVLMILQPLLG